jgi:hypothetical protein
MKIRNGYAVCYAYTRSYCKLKEDDDFCKVTSLDTCIRVSILKNFLLKGMDPFTVIVTTTAGF